MRIPVYDLSKKNRISSLIHVSLAQPQHPSSTCLVNRNSVFFLIRFQALTALMGASKTKSGCSGWPLNSLLGFISHRAMKDWYSSRSRSLILRLVFV